MPRYNYTPSNLQPGYVSQFVPIDYQFITGEIDKRQQRIDTATLNKGKAVEDLNKDFAVTPEDQEYLDNMREGIKNDFKDIINKYDGDLSTASNDLVTYIGNMRSDPFWQSNEINKLKWDEYEKKRMEFGDQAVQFMKPSSVTKFDENGTFRGIKTPQELQYEIEKKTDSEQIATDIYKNLQADSKFKGIDYIGYWAKFNDIKEITDQKIKDVAHNSINAFKEADPQFLRRILLNNGMYNASGITPEQAEQLLNKKAREEGVIYNGKLYKGDNQVDNIIYNFLIASNADRPYEQEDYKVLENPYAVEKLRAQFTPQPRQYPGESGYLQQVDPIQEVKDALVKNKELTLTDLGAVGRIIENTNIEKDPNAQNTWFERLAWNLVPSNIKKAGAVLKEVKNKQVSTIMNSKGITGDPNDYLIKKDIDGNPTLVRATQFQKVPYTVTGGEMSQETLKFLKNRYAGTLYNAGLVLSQDPSGNLDIKSKEGKPLNFDEYTKVNQFVADRINDNYTLYNPTWENPIVVDAKGKESTYGQSREDDLGLTEFNKNIYGEKDKDKIISSAASNLNIDLDNKNFFYVGGNSDYEGQYLENASFSDIIKNNKLPLIGFNVIGNSNDLPGVGPMDIIEIRMGAPGGKEIKTIKTARPRSDASILDYLDAGQKQIQYGYEHNNEIVIPLDKTAQTDILNSRELGETTEFAQNPKGKFVKIVPVTRGNNSIGFEVIYPSTGGIMKSMNNPTNDPNLPNSAYYPSVEEAYNGFYSSYIDMLSKPKK